MTINRNFWKGRRVFLTGHTGFKGGWLALWLLNKGAIVFGYALHPPTEPSFFITCNLESQLDGSTIADIRDTESLNQAMQAAQPEIVFHLAAQPLVRHSYSFPVETYAINIMGTVNLLEAVRQTPSVKTVVNVTTDKCYENREWVWPYRENEAMGGFDPYSSSKACSELITAAYRSSFLEPSGVSIASARAGNVIGGGDWATDRLIPDFIRSIDTCRTLTIRSPLALRPWQHVLEPLSGYLILAQKLHEDGKKISGAWNFGPEDGDTRTVQWIVDYLCREIPGTSWHCDNRNQPHEANTLKLDSSKAKNQLGWKPRRNLQEALGMTLKWHEAWKNSQNMVQVSLEQIHQYESDIFQHE